MELQKAWSKINVPLAQRVFCYFCNGLTEKKPHPPIVMFLAVASVYDLANIKIANVTIYQRLPVTDVLQNYRDFLRKRNPRPTAKAEDGPKEKDRHNPYISRFKCPECALKPSPNKGNSTFNVLNPKDRVLGYDCTSGTLERHKHITFRVSKIFFQDKKGLPFSFELYDKDYKHWLNWVQVYFRERVQSLPVRQVHLVRS